MASLQYIERMKKQKAVKKLQFIAQINLSGHIIDEKPHVRGKLMNDSKLQHDLGTHVADIASKRKRFSDALGAVRWTISRRDDVIILTYPLDTKLLLLVTDKHYSRITDVREATIKCLTDYINSEIPENERVVFEKIQYNLREIENQYDQLEKAMREVAHKVKDAQKIPKRIPVSNIWYDAIIDNKTGKRLDGSGPHLNNIPKRNYEKMAWVPFETYLANRMSERVTLTNFGDLHDTITYRENSLVMSYLIDENKTFVLIVGLTKKSHPEKSSENSFSSPIKVKVSSPITKAYDLANKINNFEYDFILSKFDEFSKLPLTSFHNSLTTLERAFFFASLESDPLRREQLDIMRFLIIEMKNLLCSTSSKTSLKLKINEFRSEIKNAIEIRDAYAAFGTNENDAFTNAIFDEKPNGIIELEWKE